MWFAVPIYFRSSEPVGRDILLEEAIHLISAESEDEAVKKAKALAGSLEHRYKSVFGREVHWTLDEIGEPWALLDEVVDGAELFSRFITGKNRTDLREPLPEEGR